MIMLLAGRRELRVTLLGVDGHAQKIMKDTKVVGKRGRKDRIGVAPVVLQIHPGGVRGRQGRLDSGLKETTMWPWPTSVRRQGQRWFLQAALSRWRLGRGSARVHTQWDPVLVLARGA